MWRVPRLADPPSVSKPCSASLLPAAFPAWRLEDAMLQSSSARSGCSSSGHGRLAFAARPPQPDRARAACSTFRQGKCTPRAARARCAASGEQIQTEDAAGFRSDCGKWFIRDIRDEDVPAIADIQTDAFHEEYAFKPIDSAFKGFFRVRGGRHRCSCTFAAGAARFELCRPCAQTSRVVIRQHERGAPRCLARCTTVHAGRGACVVAG